jgi:hypothetical protein
VDISDQEPIVNEERVRVGSWEWRISSNTVTWSPGMFEVYGLPPTPGCNLEAAQQRCYAEDRVVVEQAIQRSFTGGEPYNADYRIVHPIDGIRWLHSAGRVFLDGKGNPQEMRGLTGTLPGSLGAGSPVSRGLPLMPEESRGKCESSQVVAVCRQVGEGRPDWCCQVQVNGRWAGEHCLGIHPKPGQGG